METPRYRDIPGHEEAKAALRQAVESGRIPHALMLTGPSGVGKMQLARAFMAHAHCEHPVDGEPCGKCRNCRLHAELVHPDVHFSYPIVRKANVAEVSEDLKEEWLRMLRESPMMPPERWLELIEAGNGQVAIHKEEAKEILRAASFPPLTAAIKFFVVWQPEKLRGEAANALLKVIEEPADGICFLLVSDNELEVLPTIFSRTQRIRTGLLDRECVAKYMSARWGMDRDRAYQMAPLAGGSLIRADELGSHSGENEEFRGVFQTLMRDCYSRKVGNLKRSSEAVAGYGREKIIRLLNYVSGMIRENFIYNMRMPQLNRLLPEDEAFSRNFAPFINAGNVETLMEETDKARRDIERNCNAKVVMFDYFLIVITQIRKKRQ